MTLPGFLFRHATERGDELALLMVGRGAIASLTWEQLLRRSAAYAERYAAAAVRPHDVVVVCLRHGPSLYPAYLGAMLAGAIPSFVPFPTPKQDPALYWETHRVLFERVAARAVLTYPDNARDVSHILPAGTELLVDDPAPSPESGPLPELITRYPEPDADDLALLQHSSGTTGHKKGVMLTHRQITRQLASYSAALGITGNDRIASWLPLYHDMGLICSFLNPLYLGATVVSLDAFEWADNPHLLLEQIDRQQCHFTWLPNFAFNHLVRTKQGGETYRLGHMRAFVNCSEPCKVDSFREFASAFAEHGVRNDQLQVSYAMAETVFAVTQTPVGRPVRRWWLDGRQLAGGRAVVVAPGPGAVAQLSTGPAIAGIEVRVAEPASLEPRPGVAIGELQVRGDFVFAGYYQNAEATNDAFAEGWYRTGDLGCLLDGEVLVLGRRKDVIIHHGVNYYAHDIEAVASAVAGVKAGRCVALAVYDPHTGSERVELIAERDTGAYPAGRATGDDELCTALRQAVTDRYQVTLAHVHIVAPGWLLKTTSGKISRADNLAKLLLHPPPGPRDESDRPPAEVGGGFARTVLHTIAITFDVPFGDLTRRTVAADVDGWDSLGHTVLMIRLGKALGAPIPESVAARARTVGELVDLVGRHLERASEQ